MNGDNKNPSSPFQDDGDSTQAEKDLAENFRGPNVPREAPGVEMRTMKDDLKNQSGGPPQPPKSPSPPPQAPRPPEPPKPPSPPPSRPPEQPKPPTPPTPPKPPEGSPPRPPAPPKPQPQGQPRFTPPRPAQEPVFQPPGGGGAETIDMEEEHHGKGKLILIIGVVVGLVILGLIGYFVVVPILFPPLVEPPVEEVTEPTQPEETTEPTQPEAMMIEHTSAFLAPVPTEKANLASLDSLSTIQAFLGIAAANAPSEGAFKEVFIEHQGEQVAFGDYLQNFALAGSGQSFIDATQFEEDFTAFLYYDENGVWPGYIVELAPGTSATNVMLNMHDAEEILNARGFYLATYQAGTLSEFKDGQLNDTPTRYSVGTNPGAAFNYGVFGNALVISTSFEGLKALLPLIGN